MINALKEINQGKGMEGGELEVGTSLVSPPPKKKTSLRVPLVWKSKLCKSMEEEQIS